MKTSAKPVVRSPLDRLPLHQKQALLAWLTTGGPDQIGMTYEDAQKRLAAECGVKTSATALHAFFHRHHRRQVPAAPVETTVDADKITIVIYLRK
jgi:hypothetical protein